MTLALATTRIPLPNLRRLWADAPAFTTLAVLLDLCADPALCGHGP